MGINSSKSGPFFVYRITNEVNGKAYVGITRTSPEARYKRHISAAKSLRDKIVFAAAVCKYGPAAFVVETLEIVDSWEAAQEREKHFINTLGTYYGGGRGYNMTLGGDGRNTINTRRSVYKRIDEELYYQMVEAAARSKMGVKEWLEEIIRQKLSEEKGGVYDERYISDKAS